MRVVEELWTKDRVVKREGQKGGLRYLQLFRRSTITEVVVSIVGNPLSMPIRNLEKKSEVRGLSGFDHHLKVLMGIVKDWRRLLGGLCSNELL